MTHRRTSCFIPYRKSDTDRYEVFLQKRSKDAPRLPDYFGFFGGGIDGDETPEQALHREMQEELAYATEEVSFLGIYRDNSLHAFSHKAPQNFEEQITVLEGDYGKWFSKEDCVAEIMLIDLDKIILADFFEKLEREAP